MRSPAVQAAVDRSAAPPLVGVAIDRLTESHRGLADRLESDVSLRAALVAVTGASRSLTDVLAADPSAVEVLANLESRPPRPDLASASADDLRRWKQLELLRIAARDLRDIDDLPAVGRALAALAADVLEGATALAGGTHLAVIGMGKLGGAELNYSSDIDVMFVAPSADAGDDRAARALLAVARGSFRVDANLRPEGRDGPLTRTVDSYEAYWDRWAQTWEFQALLKARPVAGDADLGRAFLDQAQRRLWDRPFTPDDVRAVRVMKARAEAELARKGLTDREVKRGRGGIRDIEFAVQLLQLVHGRHDRDLRSPTTLDALLQLSTHGYIDRHDAHALDEAYRLLRTVEHRLQLEREQQVHALPTDRAAQDRLARVLGYRDTGASTAGELLVSYLRRLQAGVRSIHEHLFFRPLLDTLSAQAQPAAAEAAVMSPEAVADRLAAFGFTDAKRTRAALQELTRGLTRSSRLMQQFLPLLLGWLSEAPDPDLGLLGLRKLASGGQRATELAVAFRDSPEAAHRLCVLLGTSARLSATLEREPDLIPALAAPGGLDARPPDALLEAANAALTWRADLDDRQRGLRRFRRREELRIAAADVLADLLADLLAPEPGAVAGSAPAAGEVVVRTAARLTALAEASLEAALASLEPTLPFAVIAMGRFGGSELSYASDLDALFVYDGHTPDDFAAAEHTAEAMLRFINGRSPANQVYPLDLGLRPEGKDGPLARSLDGYRKYYDRWAQTWELQALVRARFAAGDSDLGRRFLDLVEPYVWREPFPEDGVREIRRMKARVERERIPPGEDPQFHLKLGRGSLSDIEWTAQLLQLRHGVRATGTMAALDALAAAGLLDAEDHQILAESYRFCERTRNRWFLVKGAPDDSLPRQADQLARLARSLDSTSGELRENYRRVTRRARRVVERLFYGSA